MAVPGNVAPDSRYIVHIVKDEKFIDMAAREFEAVAPGTSRYVIVGRERKLRYISNTKVSFCSLRQALELVNAADCAAVIFHSLASSFAPVLKGVRADQKVFWIGWGYDYYSRLLSTAFPAGLRMEQTAALPGRARLLLDKATQSLKRLLGLSPRYSDRLLARIDYFSPLDVEYQMVCRYNPWFRARYVPWMYGTIEDYEPGDSHGDKPLGDSILVGNNAVHENNHLEMFEILKRHVELTGKSIIAPLSYGNGRYREQVIARGREMFGAQFVPLTEFLPRDAYIELLQGCGHVFFNHLRQQAVGNICIMMLKGAQIYLNERNPLYGWLVSRGAIVQSIDSLAGGNDGGKIELVALSEAERAVNQDVIRGHFGREVQRGRTRALVDIALEQ